MKKIYLFSLFVILFFSSVQAARGPGGGGRGGGRGGSRGGRPASRPASRAAPRQQNRAQNPAARTSQNLNRSPAMSHPPINRPAAANRPSQMPAAVQRPRPTVANQAQVRNETRQFTQQLRNVQGNIPRKMAQPQNFGSTLQNQSRINAQATNRVSNTVRQRFPQSGGWFNDRFFDSHRSYDFFGLAGANWWGVPAWGTVASWFPWGWQDPYYYYYPGYNEYGYPPASDLYVQLTEQALQPTAGVVSGGAVTTNAGSWMPLGVFAAGVSEQDAAYSNFFIQLAVDQTGQIAGTFYNAATDEAQPLAGTVDSKTQQAVWKVSDDPNSPVMMTGLYNLTKDATEVQVYFTDEGQSWFLVRVNK